MPPLPPGVEACNKKKMKQGILLAAFGSGSPQGDSALKLFDARVRERFPGMPVRWAFTSVLLRQRLARVRNKKTDSVRKALQKMWFEKYTHVAVQPLQTIPGNEYAEVLADVAAMRGGPRGFSAVAAGAPLLAEKNDVTAAAAAVVRHLPPEREPGEPVVLMGHGTRHEAVTRYGELARAVHALDAAVHVGAMHGAVTLEDILPRLEAGRRVWLMPLLSVVGRHALNDMAGPDADSWRSRIETRGCLCVPVLKGTAEYAGFIDIWLDHLAEVLRRIRTETPCALFSG